MPNPIENYSDFIIKDISSSYDEQKDFINIKTVNYVPVTQTIDGPLSLKGTCIPYRVTVSKIKEQ